MGAKLSNDIALDMLARAFGRQQVARPGIVTVRGKSVPNDARELAGY